MTPSSKLSVKLIEFSSFKLEGGFISISYSCLESLWGFFVSMLSKCWFLDILVKILFSFMLALETGLRFLGIGWVYGWAWLFFLLFILFRTFIILLFTLFKIHLKEKLFITYSSDINHANLAFQALSICGLLFCYIGRLVCLPFLPLLLCSLFSLCLFSDLLSFVPSLTVLNIFFSFSFWWLRVRINWCWPFLLIFIAFFFFSVKVSSKGPQQWTYEIVSFIFINRTVQSDPFVFVLCCFFSFHTLLISNVEGPDFIRILISLLSSCSLQIPFGDSTMSFGFGSEMRTSSFEGESHNLRVLLFKVFGQSSDDIVRIPSNHTCLNYYYDWK